ncbi:MAG: hypothetical protein Q7V53_02995 [Caldisericota bacterium]|nr:hypothetical protein [Caldisericota bacterium]
MIALVGNRVDRCDGTGVVGTIVCASRESTWSSSLALVYEIVWDDKTCARKVPMSLIQSKGWKLTPERVDAAECDRIWYDYQIERTRQMAQRHGAPGGARPIVVDRQKRMQAQQAAPAFQLPALAVVTDRPASVQARLLLEEAIAGVQFAVTVDHKKLNVAWLDGPVEAVVLRVLRPLQDIGKVNRILPRRVSQEATVQAAIDFVLARVWGEEDAPEAQADLMRLTPADVLSGGAALVMTPTACAVGAVPYGRLIRCVLDRWDAWRGTFVPTERTRYQLAEQSLLFPAGDQAATQDFIDFLTEVARKREMAVECFDEMKVSREVPAVERQRG